ncbi:unnamed protein product [Periconia digitata]|uniref:Delta(24)-sterol reductase n=1 Tax=Periconia digitata TaxID=1303443 RepID=A0A9W4UH94_9PLEO|nr:unnamed protein product [Periconia digitata]
MEQHHRSTATISSKVQHFHTLNQPFRIYHGSTNSTRHASFSRDKIVDVSNLNNIIAINVASKTALVEPNVPMDALVHETLKSGLLPPVVMEFPGITVGGGFVGTAGESSSFKHGFFDRSVIRAEVVLADGTIVQASEHENSELFEGLRGSFGTLGVLTLVELRLVENLGGFVEVTYLPTTSIEHAMQTLQEEAKKKEVDYLDGVLFAKNEGVIVSGKLTHKTPETSPDLRIQRFSRAHDEWFWIHAKSLCRKPTSSPRTELIPIEDYLFRYDRGAFWTGLYAFQYFHVPFTRFTRWLLDYFMHTRIMYHALHASGHTDRFIIQDIAFPASKAGEFVEWVDGELGLYPLWVCPLREDGRGSMGYAKPLPSNSPSQPTSTRESEQEEGLINIGVWGPYASPTHEYIRMNRALEAQVQKLSGLKWLYGRVFYTEEEWDSIYDSKSYDAVREKFGASGLPSIWDKVKERGTGGKDDEVSKKGESWREWVKRWIRRNPGFLSGVYGVYKAVWGGDYLLAREKKKTW